MHAYALTWLNVFALKGFIFHDNIHKKKTGKEFAQYGLQRQKIFGGKQTRARAPVARMYANRILESKDGTTSIKY